MSLTPTQLQELQTITLDLGEEFPHNADALWNAAIRIQKAGLGPVTGAGQAAFDAAVADIKQCQDDVQPYQSKQGSFSSGFDVAVLQALPIGAQFPVGNVGDIMFLETAPNTYVAVDQIVITPVGPNSVQMDEVGTTVFRTVPAASGGIEINNLSTGAGFERVLTTADISAGAVPGGLDTEIQFNNAGAFGGASGLTWDEVNARLTLDTSPGTGPALVFDNIDPSGTVIEMGGVGSGSTNWFIWRSIDNNGTAFWELMDDHSASVANHRLRWRNESGFQWLEFDASGEMRLMGSESVEMMFLDTNADVVAIRNDATLYLEQTAPNANITGHGQFYVEASDDSLHYVTEAGVDFDLTAGGAVPGGVDTNIQFNDSGAFGGDASFTWDNVTKQLLINQTGSTLAAIRILNLPTARIAIQIGGSGSSTQRWEIFRSTDSSGAFSWILLDDHLLSSGNHKLQFRNQDSDTFIEMDNSGEMSLGGIQGTEAALITGIGGTLKWKFQQSFFMEEQAAAAADVLTEGQFWVRNTLDGEPMFTNELGVDSVLNAAGAQINGTPLNTQVALWINATTIEGDAGLTFAANTLTLSNTGVFTILRGPTDVVISNLAAGGDIFYNTLADHVFQIAGATLFEIDNGGARFLFNDFGVFFEERSTAGPDLATYGQFWVRNDIPNTPMFTDDVGTDFVLNAGLTQPITLTADIDGDGFNLDDMGVLFMREQAAADADVTGQGQLWVLDEGFTQTLMFTADNGNDIELAAINLTDMNTGALVISGTGFVECLTFQPDINRNYMISSAFEVNAPTADDINVEMVIDTNAVFKGVLTFSNQAAGIAGNFALESGIGDVITNIVTVPTDGSATPDGTYVTIIGCLRMGATSGTHSVRCAKNADTGANGQFEATAALQASVLQVS
jgi:hypothetical protein